MDRYEIMSGSVIGHEHISLGKCLIGRNNQDAHKVVQTPHRIVGVVCDGCGSGAHSEFGAWEAATPKSSTIIFCLRS